MLKRTGRWLLLVGALASPAGCDLLHLTGGGAPAPEQSRAGPPMTTDSAVYHLRGDAYNYRMEIGFTYTNPTRRSVQVSTCHGAYPPSLEKWQDGAWVGAWFPVVPMCLGAPLVIGPGESYRDALHLTAGRRDNLLPRFEVDPIPGTYRLVWLVGAPGVGALPLEQRVSAPFEIVE